MTSMVPVTLPLGALWRVSSRSREDGRENSPTKPELHKENRVTADACVRITSFGIIHVLLIRVAF
jgi:hypothetical protein